MGESSTKVSFLINSLAGGGAERVAVNLGEFLNVDKIFLLERDVKYDFQKTEIILLSNHTNRTSPILKSLLIPVYAFKLSKNLRRDSVVVSFLERTNYVNILSTFISKHKAIISVRTPQESSRNFFHPYNFLSRLLYPSASFIVCVSKSIARELEVHYGVPKEKLKVIYNPLDIDRIRYLMSEPILGYEKIFNFPTLINVGRLTKPKGAMVSHKNFQ